MSIRTNTKTPNFLRSARIALLALAIAAPAGAGLAQVVNPDNRDQGVYAGVDRHAFYNPADRIRVIRARIARARDSGGLDPRAAARALHRLDAIDRYLDFRIQRKGGELRDWDRELINDQLDDFISAYPIVRS